MERFVADMRRGWDATGREIILGALMALAVSGPLAILLGVATPLDGGVLVMIVGTVQLGLGYALAGRLARHHGGGS